MNPKDWTVCLVEPNKFETQIIVDLLRNAGVTRIKTFTDAQAATQALELYPANVVIAALELTPTDGVAWTRAFRRNRELANRKAAIFLTSHAFSRSVAEECRHAGANALIGKPVSGATILATVKKVLTHPREFIDAENYVGPCRRAGIVTAGAGSRRRQSDKRDAEPRARAEAALPELAAALAKAGAALIGGSGKVEACEEALRMLQHYAKAAGDGPLMRACAAFTLHLSAKDVRPEARKAALAVCLSGIGQLAELAVGETEKREAVVEQVREAVAKAAVQKAA